MAEQSLALNFVQSKISRPHLGRIDHERPRDERKSGCDERNEAAPKHVKRRFLCSFHEVSRRPKAG